MKSKLMLHKCLDENCGWEEKSHKSRDGHVCPKCEGFILSITKRRNE